MQGTPSPPVEAAAPVAAAAEPGPSAPAPTNQHRLMRNTMYLTVAQAITIPISVASNALMGRYLGSEAFGHLYLATTLCAFAVLALDWGQQGALPALIARNRDGAGTYLGTSLAWRSFAAVIIAGVLAVVCVVFGYTTEQRWAVGLAFPVFVLASFAAAFKDTIRGFERTDVPALAHVAQQFLGLLVVVPVLLLGGQLRAVLISSVIVVAVIVVWLRRALPPLGVSTLSFQRSALKALFAIGTPFVFFDLAMVLLPYMNAQFLSELVPAEVIGWYGVSQRLVGLLLFPASALIGALYPTLCRLFGEDQPEFTRVARNALYGVSLLAVPAAVGCGLFPELGVAIFGTDEFSGATDHLRVMSIFVFLVYFSMPLGTTILASNRQRAWALVQCICIVFSLAGNPFLIPYFQKATGNGALGTCVMLVASEALVVSCGLALAPRGLFNRELIKSLALTAASGVAMIAVGWFTKPISLFLAVPAALLTYGVVAWFSGAVQPATAEMVKAFLVRRLRRS